MMHRIKIGIITLSASDNCGSLLQAYALQQIIEKRFCCEVEIINFVTQQSKLIYDLFPRGFYKHPKKTLFTLRYFKSIKRQKDGYQKFRDNYLNFTDTIYGNTEELKKMNDNYDIIITGSDQVWNVNMSDYDDAFFLPWGGKAKKIAYATSLGATQVIEPHKQDYIRECLEQFGAISIREETGRATINSLIERKIDLAADPTLLLETENWSSIAGARMVKKPYIFYYSWSYPDEKMHRLVQQFASEHNLEVYVINSSKWYKFRPKKFKFKLFEESGPTAFLNLMKYADFVFVQSFHGAIFANIFEKRFFVLNEKENGTVDFRMKNIIGILDQDKQIVHNMHDVYCAIQAPISYSSDKYIRLINDSLSFLDKSIKN